MPSSSLAAACMLEAWSFFANSPSSFAERSATSCSTRTVSSELSGCILSSIASPLTRRKPRHAVIAHRAREQPVVVQVVQVGNGLAHGEKDLARIELAPEQDFQHVRRAAR